MDGGHSECELSSLDIPLERVRANPHPRRISAIAFSNPWMANDQHVFLTVQLLKRNNQQVDVDARYCTYLQ